MATTPAGPNPVKCSTATCAGDARFDEYPCATCGVRFCRPCEMKCDKAWYDLLRVGQQPVDVILCGACVTTKRWRKHPADILLAMNGQRAE